jgi:hypothetical protein
LHKEECLKAIAKGKHVLCEKPMAINAKEAEEMIEAARSKGVFFMEGVFQTLDATLGYMLIEVKSRVDPLLPYRQRPPKVAAPRQDSW